MDCHNCGAPMKAVPDKSYFACEYCGSLFFPMESPDGIGVLDEDPSDVDCPVCNVPLFRASIDGFPVLHCKTCKGTLTDQVSFGDIVKHRRARASGPLDLPRPLDSEELQRNIRCPQCGERMETHPYHGPGNIVIDSCGKCRMVWLDYGELVKAINAPGRDRPV